MKEGWIVKKLGEVCEILDSLRKPVTKKDRREGIYPYYGASGIQDYVDSYIFDGRYLLVGEDGAKWGASDKSAYIIEGKSWVNNHAHILKVNSIINDKLLEYYLVFKDLSEYITGAIVPKLTQQALRSIPIPIPPLPEQSRIVEELDLLSNIIEKKRQQLSELDNLAQSIFYDMFGDPVTNEKGWEVKRLDMIVSKDCPISYGIVQPGEDVMDGIPIVRPIDLIDTYVRVYGLKKTKEEISKAYKRTILRGDELLLCVRGTTGLSALATEELKGCNVTRGIVPLFFDDHNRWFIYLLLKQKSMLRIIGELTYGIALKQINIKDLRSLPIILPPLNLQQLFAKKIEAIEKQKALIKQSIAETEELFNSRMDYYFS